jgi:exopolyphosphatase/pppGpp-phosphohydrolase
MQFMLPVMLRGYNGESVDVVMGPFEHSTEREFALTVNKKAIQECRDIDSLKQVATNLLVGWSGMQTAMQKMIIENIELRQALNKKELDLEAAEAIVAEAAELIEKQYGRQSWRAKWRLWPWQK